MELREAIRIRKSIRTFSQKDVPDIVLHELIEAAKKGPSAGGIRGYEGIVSREVTAYGSPVSVVICINQDAYTSRYGDRGRDLYAIQDGTIFGAYLQLLLVEAGLCSVWVGAFREGRVRRILKTELKPIAIIALGYKDERV